MQKIILFDKFKNRKEDEVENVTEEILLQQEEEGTKYNIKYILQFYDAKRRAVYVEKSRTITQK